MYSFYGEASHMIAHTFAKKKKFKYEIVIKYIYLKPLKTQLVQVLFFI